MEKGYIAKLNLYFQLMNVSFSVVEGLVLLEHGVNPYDGDRLHEAPIFMLFYKFLIHCFGDYLSVVFVVCDLTTAYILYELARLGQFEIFLQQEENKSKYGKNVKHLLQKGNDFFLPPFYVLATYCFNPFTIFTCVGQTTTVFCNLFLAVFLLTLISRIPLNGKCVQLIFSLLIGFVAVKVVLCSFTLAVVTTHSFYPVMLLIPLILKVSQEANEKKHKWIYGTLCCLYTLGFLLGFPFLSGFKDVDFLNNPFGFM